MILFRREVAWLPLLAFALSVTACKDTAGPDQLLLTVAVAPARIVPGDTAAIVVRVTNPTASRVGVPDDLCAHRFEIANADGDIVVGREPIYCIAIVRQPTVLGPSESITWRFGWTGERQVWTGNSVVTEPVPAGVYRVYGRLQDRLSAPATIEIEAPVP